MLEKVAKQMKVLLKKNLNRETGTMILDIENTKGFLFLR